MVFIGVGTFNSLFYIEDQGRFLLCVRLLVLTYNKKNNSIYSFIKNFIFCLIFLYI